MTKEIKGQIAKFLRERIGIVLRPEKTLVTKGSEFVHFLGHKFVCRPKGKVNPNFKWGPFKRYWDTLGVVQIYPDVEHVRAGFKEAGYMKSLANGTMISKSVDKLIPLTDEQIVGKFASLWRGLLNYYRFCEMWRSIVGI